VRQTTSREVLTGHSPVDRASYEILFRKRKNKTDKNAKINKIFVCSNTATKLGTVDCRKEPISAKSPLFSDKNMSTGSTVLIFAPKRRFLIFCLISIFNARVRLATFCVSSPLGIYIKKKMSLKFLILHRRSSAPRQATTTKIGRILR